MLRRGQIQGLPVVELVPGFIEAVLDRMSKWLNRSAASLSSNDLHELRIEFKGLRYTTEFFSDLYAGKMRRVIRGFVQFQDCLGLFQDAEVASQTLRRYSEKVMKKGAVSADVMLGVGGLIQLQREIQEQQQAHFIRMWQSLPGQIKDLRKLLRTHAFYTHV
jgi:CHAD domain-containing protein